ncbi:hypothetical protein Vafri_20683 [Volvox africanus]|uniref:Uncharacterized protein n=1 Tax=Volvox africanus TaxID=51714 RepID=A0A8J4BQI6_9CHLO|nr:hypothetical protein Vafri_20683 [Volvox africanus]
MSSNALPPLTGNSSGGSREDREEQRTQKVKPLPLMLSSRAPLVQAAGASLRSGSPGQGSTRGRPGAGPQPPQQQQQLQPPHHLYQTAADAPPSPGSPNAQHHALNRTSSKFTRIRGFQTGTPPLGLEGSGLLHPLAGQGGRPGSNVTGQPSSGHLDEPQPHHSWDGGHGSPGLVASPPRQASGGRLLGSGGGAALSTSVSVVDTWQQANGGGGGGGGSSGGGGWASRRAGLLGERSGVPTRGREGSPLEGPGAAALIMGPSTTGLSLAAVGSAPLGVRQVNSAASAKPFASLASATAPTGVYRSDTAPSSPSLPLDHPLASTLPPRVNHTYGHGLPTGLVPPAVINPPFHLPAAWPAPAGVDGSAFAAGGGGGGGGGGLLPPPAVSSGNDPHAEHSSHVGAAASSEASSPQRLLLPPQPQPQFQTSSSQSLPTQQQQPPSATAAQILQRLYRTNRTPPNQNESGQDIFSTISTQRNVSASSPGASGGGGGRTYAGPATADHSRSASPGPLPPSPTVLIGSGGGGGGGGGGTAGAMSLSGALPSSVVSRPGTTNTVASSLAASLLNRPRGRGAAAGTLADLSAALQKSIAAGMGEWDLRADGTWCHPEIQQRLLRGPLGPEALKNRYRMQERDIISLYRLLYSYSVGFFTDVEALLDIAVSDRNSGAAIGLKVGTSLRQELLENVFRAYATLWDEALMIVFDSEMTSMLADKNAALKALDRGAVELEALKRDKQELQTRLEDFMKQNVDNMLASRHLQQATTRLEGEIYTLHNANEQLVTNMARHAVQVATLERQLDAAHAATQAAESRAVSAEAHLHDLKAIISEQNAGLSAQFFQIKELERMCSELQETVRNLNRRRAAVLGLLSGNTPDPSDPGAIAAAAAAGGAAGSSPPTTTAGAATRGATNSGLAGASSRALITGSGGASASGAAHGRPGTGDDGGGGGSGGAAGLDSTTEGVMADLSLLDPDELGRLLSDKTRAFNLMHADFVVKMHELDEQRAANEILQQEIAVMKEEVRKSAEAAAASDRTAARFRAKFEAGRMSMEDLEEKNRKLTHKNAELVRSYWPLMTRLKDAEAEASTCREEAARDREQAAADRAEADELRAAASDMKAAMQELEERRAEAASHELELPADIVALLPEGQVAALRRFTRSCHRRVAHLNSQVVALVDQVTQARLQSILQKEQNLLNGSGGVGGGSAYAESAIVAVMEEATELRAAVANRDKWLAVLNKAMSALMGQMENLMARDWETCRTLRLEQDRRKRRAAREARRALARQTTGMSGAESANASASASVSMSPERSAVSLGENSYSQSVSSSPAPAAADAAAAATAGDSAAGAVRLSAEASGAALSEAPRSGAVSAEASQSTATAATPAATAATDATATVTAESSAAASPYQDSNSGGGGSSGEVVGAADAASSKTGGQKPQHQESSGQPEGGGKEGNVEGDATANGNASTTADADADVDADDAGDNADDDGGVDDGMTVAAGRLAQMVDIGSSAGSVERNPHLVALDTTYDRLVDSAERLIEWSEGLLRRKEQTATFTQVRQKLDTVTRQLDAALLELTTLRPAADALRHSVRGYEVKFKDMSMAMASCKQRAETAESRLASVEAQLSVVTQQLREAQDAQKLLEDEYWKAKDIALEAEVTTGELKAGRIRALEAAAKALASVSGLEKQSRENRDQRVALEADLVGYKAWVRHMEAIERKHRVTLQELADATTGCEERDRKLADLKDRVTTLEQQLRFKSIETASLESRVKALSGELVEERRAARVAVAAARGSTALQLDTAIRQAGAAESEAAARGERVAVLEGRLAEVTRSLDEAQAAATAAEARLVPLIAERDRLRAHIAASQPLLQTMNKAAEAIDRRIALLEDAAASVAAGGNGATHGSMSQGPHVRFGLPVGSLEAALEALLLKVDGALDACSAVAEEAAGDATPAVLGALEGLVAQLLSTLSKGGQVGCGNR